MPTLNGLKEALEEAKRQLEYLDERFPTGTTPSVIAKINYALSDTEPLQCGSTCRFKVGQLVRYEHRNATVYAVESDGLILVIKEDSGVLRTVGASSLQPRSIKKSHGVEGKNFID